jgi:hypothetical protein
VKHVATLIRIYYEWNDGQLYTRTEDVRQYGTDALSTMNVSFELPDLLLTTPQDERKMSQLWSRHNTAAPIAHLQGLTQHIYDGCETFIVEHMTCGNGLQLRNTPIRITVVKFTAYMVWELESTLPNRIPTIAKPIVSFVKDTLYSDYLCADIYEYLCILKSPQGKSLLLDASGMGGITLHESKRWQLLPGTGALYQLVEFELTNRWLRNLVRGRHFYCWDSSHMMEMSLDCLPLD